MKRLIDVLTLVTMALAVLATDWSIDSFGQISSAPNETDLSQDLDQTIYGFIDEGAHADAAKRGTGQAQDLEISEQPVCKTFDFMGDQYFSDPDANYVESCARNKVAPTGYFKFLGDYYPNLPEEQVKLDFTF